LGMWWSITDSSNLNDNTDRKFLQPWKTSL